MTPEEIRDEARELRLKRGIEVAFKITCKSFTVPEWHGLDVSATYSASGTVTPDRSGDHITPNGPPDVFVTLDDATEYQITLDGCPLPEWLQWRLSTQDRFEMDLAFLAAIGGQSKLDELAIEKAL